LATSHNHDIATIRGRDGDRPAPPYGDATAIKRRLLSLLELKRSASSMQLVKGFAWSRLSA